MNQSITKAKLKQKHKVWLDLYLNNCQKLNKSPHTILNYRCDLLKFLTWFELVERGPINKSNARTIEKYKDYLSGVKIEKAKGAGELIKSFFWRPATSDQGYIQMEALSVGSKRRHLSSVKNFFEFLIQYFEDQGRLFKANPVRAKLHAIKLKDIDVEHTVLLTHKDFYLIENHIFSPKDKLIIYLLYYGGLRLAELTQLKLSNFSQANQTLTFIRKGGEIHTIKLQAFDQVVKVLSEYLMSRRYNQDFLFVNKFGRPLSVRSMYSKIKRILREAGLGNKKLSPHSFRKACATNLYKETKDILLVRNYLNHKDAKVTQTYIEY